MAVTKRCVVCNKLFQGNTSSKTCSLECRKINNRKVNNAAHRVMYHRKKRLSQIARYKSNSLDTDLRRARELGISYGQYKAMQAV